MKHILLVEDEQKLAVLVRKKLEQEGYKVTCVGDGASALIQIRQSQPDLLVLDIALPQLSGLEVCKVIRRNPDLDRLPILILSGKKEEGDRVLGLELGADDYLTKPCSLRELCARVKALLRRVDPPGGPHHPITLGTLHIDPVAFQVVRSGEPVRMSTLEFRLLYFLASHPNRVFSRDQLLDAVWGLEHFVTPRSVDTYIWRLREKIEDDPEKPRHLKSLRGAGYIFELGDAS